MKLTIEITSREGKFRELYQTLKALLPMIRKEKGCLDCRIYRDVEDGVIMFLSTRWEARVDLEHFVRSRSGSALLGAVDLLGETARIGFGEDLPLQGIDVLKRMRKRT